MQERNNPQESIAYGVGAGLASAMVFTAVPLMLYFNLVLIPSDPSTQHTNTTTQTPSQPHSINSEALAFPAVIASLSMLAVLYFALLFARNEITTRQRQLAVASGIAGTLSIADAAALPITLIHLRSSEIPTGVTVGVITPAYLALYAALFYAAIRLYHASRQPDSNEMNQAPLIIGADAGERRHTGSENDATPQVTYYGGIWSKDGSQSSMSTINDSARSASSIDTTFAINHESRL